MSSFSPEVRAWIIANADAIADVLAYLKFHNTDFQALLTLARWDEVAK